MSANEIAALLIILISLFFKVGIISKFRFIILRIFAPWLSFKKIFFPEKFIYIYFMKGLIFRYFFFCA